MLCRIGTDRKDLWRAEPGEWTVVVGYDAPKVLWAGEIQHWQELHMVWTLSEFHAVTLQTRITDDH
jgi:hypothetical protein